MSKGEQPRARPKAGPSKVICDALGPLGGTLRRFRTRNWRPQSPCYGPWLRHTCNAPRNLFRHCPRLMSRSTSRGD